MSLCTLTLFRMILFNLSWCILDLCFLDMSTLDLISGGLSKSPILDKRPDAFVGWYLAFIFVSFLHVNKSLWSNSFDFHGFPGLSNSWILGIKDYLQEPRIQQKLALREIALEFVKDVLGVLEIPIHGQSNQAIGVIVAKFICSRPSA